MASGRNWGWVVQWYEYIGTHWYVGTYQMISLQIEGKDGKRESGNEGTKKIRVRRY